MKNKYCCVLVCASPSQPHKGGSSYLPSASLTSPGRHALAHMHHCMQTRFLLNWLPGEEVLIATGSKCCLEIRASEFLHSYSKANELALITELFLAKIMFVGWSRFLNFSHFKIQDYPVPQLNCQCWLLFY